MVVITAEPTVHLGEVPWNERHCHGRASEDPIEKLMGASGLPEEALVSVEHDHSNERVILK